MRASSPIKRTTFKFSQASPTAASFSKAKAHACLLYEEDYRGGCRNFLRGGGMVNKSYKKVGVDPKRGWVREGDMPPPARSAEAFDTIQVLKH